MIAYSVNPGTKAHQGNDLCYRGSEADLFSITGNWEKLFSFWNSGGKRDLCRSFLGEGLKGGLMLFSMRNHTMRQSPLSFEDWTAFRINEK